MKKSDISALHESSIKQLLEKLEKTQLELVQSRLALSANKLEDSSKVYRLRKEVAKIKTVLTIKKQQEGKTEKIDNDNKDGENSTK